MVSLDTTYDIEYRKANGIYYTPEVIVEYMVRETVGRLIEDKCPEEINGISIVDPACGDGNFLVGAYKYLVEYHRKWYDEHKDVDEYKSDWYIKDGILELTETKKQGILLNNIYGVDIDQNAINHAIIRMQELVGDIDLSSNIKCGNSLIGTDYFSNMLFYDDALWNEIKPFDWHKEFPKVFQNGGFDVIIGNPPYIGEKGHKEIFEKVKNGTLCDFYVGKMNYFYFFFHLALNIVRDNGIIAFITTNYYITALGGKKLREDLYNRATIKKLINFNELKIFKSATGQHNMITILQKGKNKNELANTCITHRKGHATSEILQKIFSGDDDETDYYQITQENLYDGNEHYIRLIPNDNEPIQKILDKIKAQGIYLGIICNVNPGVITGADKVSKKHINEYDIKAKVGDGIFVLSDYEVKQLDLTDKEKEILKPFFKNSDIYRWYTNSQNNDLLLFLGKKLNEEYISQNYKNIYQHLSKYKYILLEKRKNLNEKLDKWFSLHKGTAHPKKFIYPKIVAPQRSPRNTFGYNEIPWYASADVYFITQKDENVSLKYILALLNSKLYYIWLYYRGKRKGEILELIAKPLSEIPIKKIAKDDQQPFIDLVDKILAITKDDDYLENPVKQEMVKEYERQIDQMVYKLYDLTEEEIKIVEGGN